MSEAKPIRTRTRQKCFRFKFPSLTSLFVSSLWIYCSQYLLVGFIRFLHEQYDGFTMHYFSNFELPEFFGELSRKKVHFSDFIEGEGHILESCLYSKLGNANVFEIFDVKVLSWAACCNSILQRFFSTSFCQKKWRKFLNFHEQNRRSPWPTAFLNFDAQFLQTHSLDPFVCCLAAFETW